VKYKTVIHTDASPTASESSGTPVATNNGTAGNEGNGTDALAFAGSGAAGAASQPEAPVGAGANPSAGPATVAGTASRSRRDMGFAPVGLMRV
jgi:hypothetical protein